LLLLAWLAAAPTGAGAQPPAPTASRLSVMAAYLYKFPAYVQWPAGHFAAPNAPLTIGVLGMDALAEELAAITGGRRVADRPIRVRRIEADEALQGLDVLFIGSQANDRLSRIASTAQQQSILIVTDAEDALPQGSVINFRTIDGRVRFDVALRQAERHGLRMSSGLLSVAARVHGVTR
jgi:hypothetical protein